MDLISPKFLQTCQNKRAAVLKELFQDEDVFKVVMDKKKMSFTEACEWIATEVFCIDLPLASPSEVEIMKLAAKEMVTKLKKDI